MTASFLVGATLVEFGMLLADARLERAAAITVRHIPGGNVTNVDFGGLQAPTLRGRALLATYADLVALQGLCGQSGTLSYSEDVYTAILLSCSQAQSIRGDSTVRFADLDFLVVLPT